MIKKIKEFFDNRILIIKCLLFLVGLVLMIRLIDIQIVNGEEYRKESESKMLRETVIEAPRGEIYDRNGVVLATNKLGYDVVMYKVDIKEEELNKTLLKIINILEKNNDEIYSTFPMDEIKEGFYSNEYKKSVCDSYEIDVKLKNNEIINALYEKFGLNNIGFKNNEKFKVLKLRYELDQNIFSLFNGVVIAKDVSYNSMAVIEESKADLIGVQINVTSKRYYPYKTIASHLLGYVSSISSE